MYFAEVNPVQALRKKNFTTLILQTEILHSSCKDVASDMHHVVKARGNTPPILKWTEMRQVNHREERVIGAHYTRGLKVPKIFLLFVNRTFINALS